MIFFLLEPKSTPLQIGVITFRISKFLGFTLLVSFQKNGKARRQGSSDAVVGWEKHVMVPFERAHLYNQD